MLPDPTSMYHRGLRTAVACWATFADATQGAAVRRLDGVDVAVFPSGPEREVYNNAVLAPGAGAEAIAAMEDAYAAAGVADFAAWTHESDGAVIARLRARGYRLAETTHAMGRPLHGRLPVLGPLDLVDLDWDAYATVFELPDGLLAGVDPRAVVLRAARCDGRPATTALGFHHDGDCGVFNVATVAAARRRGLATAITALLLHDAVAQGCTTATLQATPAAVGLYRACGFAELGRILEFRR